MDINEIKATATTVGEFLRKLIETKCMDGLVADALSVQRGDDVLCTVGLMHEFSPEPVYNCIFTEFAIKFEDTEEDNEILPLHFLDCVIDEHDGVSTIRIMVE